MNTPAPALLSARGVHDRPDPTECDLPPIAPSVHVSGSTTPLSLTSSRERDAENTQTSLPTKHDAQGRSLHQGFWRSFIAICVPLLLSALEGSVTNTALPTISDALNLGTSFSWVATAFLLASTILQPLYGQFGDMWGRKYPMMVAVGVFAIGSAICGGANSGGVLIFGRIVQGLGTGGVDLFAEMILCDIVPLRHRGPYLAIKHAIFAIGTTLGPLMGGVFAEHGWRWCFIINIPVCVISMIIMYFWLHVGGGPKIRNVNIKEEIRKVDMLGTAILTASVIMLLVALSMGGASHPWDHPAIIIPLLFSIGSFIGFAIYQRSKYCAHPVMPKEVFSNRTTNIAFALTTIHGFITYGFQFYLPPFFQAVKGSTPTQSGLEVLPTTIVIVVLAAAGGPLLSRWGRYKPIHIIGFGCMTLGLGLCIMLAKKTPVQEWLMFQLVVATGSVQVKLPDTTTGQSSGSWAFLRGTGSLFGVAIPGAVFNVRFASLLPGISSTTARAQLDKGQAYQHATASFVKKFEPAVQAEIVYSFTESLKCVWVIFCVLAGVGSVMAWCEQEHKMRKTLNTAYGLKTLKSAGQTPTSTVPGSPALIPMAEKSFEDVDQGPEGPEEAVESDGRFTPV
ncbi:MFS general substrate transporter [Karstenula rhodostoma CBS 690.94]|uniref:MFS general substrate transporter n=1 Tax=Karstenula rhodostoma CBS 690.94 TaxID=1392251 RepID=A0A9P4U5I6_9PLEO|nr:MFS general substrate transporter [Karstenula rhodostoma CBS 690.94]